MQREGGGAERQSRRRSAQTSFSGQAGNVRLGYVATIWACIPATITFLAHYRGVGYTLVAGLVFAAIWGGLLLVFLAVPRFRKRLLSGNGLLIPGLLFGLVVTIALGTLTPWLPGGVHPIWEWAGLPPATTVNRSNTIVEIYKLLGLACSFLVGFALATDRRWAERIGAVLICTGAAWAVIALVMFLAGWQVGAPGRLTGGFLSANSAATVLGILLVLTSGYLARDWRRSSELGVVKRLSDCGPWAAAGLVFTFALLLTGSRAGLASTVLSIGVFGIWEAFARGAWNWKTIAAAAVAFGAFAVLILQGNGLALERSADLARDVDIRAQIVEVHWQAFLNAPLFGNGLGSFTDINAYMTTAETYGALWSVTSVHNVYLQWLSEAGLIGAFPMFALVGLVMLGAGARGMTTVKGSTVLRALVASNLVVLVHGMTDFALQEMSIAALWSMLLGIQAAFGQMRDP